MRKVSMATFATCMPDTNCSTWWRIKRRQASTLRSVAWRLYRVALHSKQMSGAHVHMRARVHVCSCRAFSREKRCRLNRCKRLAKTILYVTRGRQKKGKSGARSKAGANRLLTASRADVSGSVVCRLHAGTHRIPSPANPVIR